MLAMGCGRSLRRPWGGGELHACALFGQPRPLPSLERIMSSHPLLPAIEARRSGSDCRRCRSPWRWSSR